MEKHNEDTAPVRLGAKRQKFILIDGYSYEKITKSLTFEIELDKLKTFLTGGDNDFQVQYFLSKDLPTYDYLKFSIAKGGYEVITCTNDNDIGEKIASKLLEIDLTHGNGEVIVVGGTTNNYYFEIMKVIGNFTKNVKLYCTEELLHPALKNPCVVLSDFNSLKIKIKNTGVDPSVIKDQKLRCVILIDWPNFEKMQEKLNVTFNLQKVKELLVGPNRELVEARCYLPKPLWDNHQIIKEAYEAAGYTINYGPANTDVDDTIVSDITTIAQTDYADVYILISGDHKYMNSLVSASKKHGYKVEVFCTDDALYQKYKTSLDIKVIEPKKFIKSLTTIEEEIIDTKVQEINPEVSLEISAIPPIQENQTFVTEVIEEMIVPDDILPMIMEDTSTREVGTLSTAQPDDEVDNFISMAVKIMKTGKLESIQAVVFYDDLEITIGLVSSKISDRT
jgi:uncharacterized LabA/DUF88 family protein